MPTGVAIVSGGMDSVTLAYHLSDLLHDVHLMSFDYGQRHKKELEFAAQCAEDISAPHHIVDLTGLTKLISNSSLTSPDIDVPEGHYAEESMKATVVPNRNAIMLNIAIGYAVNIGASYVATAVHAGDHAIYPDCRPEFTEAQTRTALIANEGFIEPDFKILAPFVNEMKQDIVTLGHRLGVDYTRTWTCYKGLDIHCGVCGTCVERKEAFEIAKVKDPTEYGD